MRILKKAFTLIELLVVIAVIGILSGLIVVSMSGTTQKATIAKGQVFSSSIRNSLMSSIVSEWKFEDNANDSWNGGNNGTWSGPTGDNTTANYRPTEECVSGKCLNFDGADDQISIPSNVNMNTDKTTIEFWIKPLAIASDYGQIFYRTGSYIVRYKSDGVYQFNFFVYGGSSYEPRAGYGYSESELGKWYHVAAIYDRTLTVNNLKLYINGTLKGYSNKTTTIPTSTSILYIGMNSASGNIDEVRLYNEAISSSLIRDRYYLGLNNLLANGSISQQEYSQRFLEISKK